MERKPSRIMTPSLVKLLAFVGLTNLSGKQIRDYKNLYETCYGTLQQRMLPVLHKIGLTNLTDEEVRRYCSKDN